MNDPTAGADIAILGVDPFSRAGLSDPLAVDEAIREGGGVVWSEQHRIWFTGRHEIVEQIFRDYETFESSAGTGVTNTKKTENWRKPSVILENDPPGHTKYRRIMTSILSQRVVRRLTEDFQRQADELVDLVVGRLEFDAATELAEAFPLTVLPDAVGFAPEGRQHLLPYSIDEQTGRGVRKFLVAPIGFVCDHTEILFDIDIQAAQAAREFSTALRRTESLNTSPAFIDVLEDLVRQAL